MQETVIRNIVCQVLAREQSNTLIYAVLNEFLPGYEPLNLDYVGKPDNEAFTFSSEEDMISYYVDTPNVSQTFYWNTKENNPNRIMVGANILDDNQIVFSLTLDATEGQAAEHDKRLKRLLGSEIGVISYINPAEYSNGQDFEARYGTIRYDFE